MKSVIRSSILRGSSTNVGKVTLERSIPTLIHVHFRRRKGRKGSQIEVMVRKAIVVDLPQLGY
jgi:hypothetical protein